MPNITTLESLKDVDILIVTRAQNRLFRLYQKVREKGGWREVTRRRGLSNMRYVWEFVNKTIIPTNPEVRYKLGIPQILPSEREPKKKKHIPPLGAPGWEEHYFKRMKR